MNGHAKPRPTSRREWVLETLLILTAAALCCLLYRLDAHRLVVLNMFFLPVVLAAFFLGRHWAGVYTLGCVVSATLICLSDRSGSGAFGSESPVILWLSLVVWGGVMGLNALLMGTVSDERAKSLRELHDAYVGMVEVLSRYLGNVDYELERRTRWVAQWCDEVGRELRLPDHEIDDLRVAALLRELGNVQITSRVMRRAVGELDSRSTESKTFHGTDLVHSLGQVLSGALPLLTEQGDLLLESGLTTPAEQSTPHMSLSGRILQAVRELDRLVHSPIRPLPLRTALAHIRADLDNKHHPLVTDALTRVAERLHPEASLPVIDRELYIRGMAAHRA